MRLICMLIIILNGENVYLNIKYYQILNTPVNVSGLKNSVIFIRTFILPIFPVLTLFNIVIHIRFLCSVNLRMYPESKD